MDYKTKALAPTQMQLAAQYTNRWAIKLDGYTPVDDLVKSSFWVHTSSRLSQYDVIEVHPANGAYYAELLVSKIVLTNTGIKIPSLVALRVVELEAPKAKAKEEPKEYNGESFDIAWKGPVNKHCIIRKGDKQLIEKGFSDKTSAIKRAEELEAA